MIQDNDVSPDSRSTEELDSLTEPKPSNNERAMSGPKSDDTQAPEAPKNAPMAAARDEFEFTHQGKPVRGTREQMIKWAQMGYDRPQFAQKYNQEKAKWDAERADFLKQKEAYSPYAQIDAWAKSNPSDWQRLQQMYQGAQSGQMNQAADPNAAVDPTLQPYISKIQSLEQQISQIVPQVQEWKTDREAQHQKAEDSKLDKEIQATRESLRDQDWDSLDENGKSLEMRILEHAQETGIPTFRAAARDLLHDDLMSRAQAQAKQSVSKSIQSRTKLGVLGESPTSQRRDFGMPKNIRDSSYEDLEREIREELRSGRV